MDKRWADRRIKAVWMNRPWFNEREDCIEQGDPETTVFLAKSTLVALHIRGLEEHIMLGIREDETGQPVSCAITNEILIDTFTRVPNQSNPRRKPDEGDGA